MHVSLLISALRARASERYKFFIAIINAMQFTKGIQMTHGTTDYAHDCCKSVELLFYDERNFVAIIGCKSWPTTRESRQTEY